MPGQELRSLVTEALRTAGIEVGGDRPWDVQVHDDEVFAFLIHGDTLALGEAYMAGEWDCDRIDELVYRLLTSGLASSVRRDIRTMLIALRARFANPGRRSRAFDVGRRHYDIGNDLYRAMLDRRMVYSCAYWKDATNLDEAQEAKLDLVCRKLGLKPGMKVLDIGGGWGSFAKFAAERYGVSVVNITVSQRQVELANELCQGLPVENRLMDYRDVEGRFDAIVSIGMFEHVGARHYRIFFEKAHQCLEDGGLFLLHTIGSNLSSHSCDPWVEKYIFPNSMIPSLEQIGRGLEGLFVVEDLHNIGAHYDRTLLSWYDNFMAHWEELKHSYSHEFRRMWRLYLLGSAGSFRARRMQVWQIVLSKEGVPGGYQSIR
ncbi:MAG: cyclopropane-fatty-acyl-phospholipid synthase [Armatimonadota bacterium]|nr:MAG: cyclopropane-fatty-acyl-phospholipid synthase [Armatimonadota bacterium]